MPKNKKKKRNYSISEDPFLSLGFFNMIIYLFLTIISVSISISPILILIVIKKAIAFSDPTVIATRIDDASILFLLPFGFVFLIITFVPFVRLLEQNCPIVRKFSETKDYSPFKEEFIPLLKEIFKEFYNDRIIKIMILLLVPFLFLASFSLFARVDIHSDYTVTERNLINQVSKYISTSDYDELTIDVYSASGKSGTSWGYRLIIITNDGEEIYLKNGFFKERNNIETINAMLEIKDIFKTSSIKIENAEKLEKVVDYLELNEEEQQLLNQLFSTP